MLEPLTTAYGVLVLPNVIVSLREERGMEQQSRRDADSLNGQLFGGKPFKDVEHTTWQGEQY